MRVVIGMRIASFAAPGARHAHPTNPS